MVPLFLFWRFFAVIVFFGDVTTPPSQTMPCHAATDQDAPRQTQIAGVKRSTRNNNYNSLTRHK